VLGPLILAVRDPYGLTLWLGSVEVLAGLTMDEQRSLPVTTADGKVFGDFTWLGMKESDRSNWRRRSRRSASQSPAGAMPRY